MNDTPETPSSDRKGGLFAIVNKRSGKKGVQLTEPELSRLFGHHSRFHVHFLGKGDDIVAISRQAVSDGFDTIVAAGGDGTISGVAAGVVGSNCRMGIVPLGTFNFFARSFGLPEDPEEAARIAGAGQTRPVSVGEVNGRIFLNNASLGAYAAILNQRETIYRRWGRSRLAAYWSVLVALATIRRPLSLRVTVDGTVRRYRTPIAFVGTSSYQLEEFELDGADAVRDGEFALFIAPDCGRFGMIWNALRLAVRGMRRDRDFKLITGREILIEARRSSRLVACDGELARMKGPYIFKMREDALKVVVPDDAETAAA